MSKRLQILVEDGEFEEIHRAADRAGVTMSEWARTALRRARRDRPGGDVARKLAAVRAAVVHEFPTGDIDQMLAEIEEGVRNPVILIDSTIPMYLVGAPHPNKSAAQRHLESLIGGGDALVTDVEVLQEILHRYQAIHRTEAIQPAFDALLHVVDEVISVDLAVTQRAKEIVLGSRGLSARDAIHVAVMESVDCERILSFDRGFDAHPGVQRLG